MDLKIKVQVHKIVSQELFCCLFEILHFKISFITQDIHQQQEIELRLPFMYSKGVVYLQTKHNST